MLADSVHRPPHFGLHECDPKELVMIEWSEQHLMIRDAARRFIEAEIVPNVEELEHGDMPPYDILRKLIRTFGMDELARTRFAKQIEREKSGESSPRKSDGAENRGDAAAMQLIPIIELSRYCPGMVTAMGVSMGLTAASIMSKGTTRQKERWALDLLTLDKVGSWAITEPGSGSDAFGSMKASARRDGEGGYILNGSKTFITNGPYADVIVFICKLEESGVDPKDRKPLTFVLDSGMPGLEQTKPMRKMGLHSSPTGEVFANDVKAGGDRPARRERGAAVAIGREADLLAGALRGRGDGARDHRALPRTVRRVRERARPIRSADRRVPADSGQARANGSRAHECREHGSCARSGWQPPGNRSASPRHRR